MRVAHVVLQVSRKVLDRLMRATPLEVDPSGQPLEILDPPFTLRRSLPTPLGPADAHLIVRSSTLNLHAGTDRATLGLHFDSSSVELLGLGKSVSMFVGRIDVTVGVSFRQRTLDPPESALLAELGVDFASAKVKPVPDADSASRLERLVGAASAQALLDLLGTALAGVFHERGFAPTGLTYRLTPGANSEDMRTLSAMPESVFLDAETLSVTGRFAPQQDALPVTPLLDQAAFNPVAYQLSAEGFRRTVRNRAVRRLARDSVSERRLGELRKTHDEATAATKLAEYLATPEGIKEVSDETPAPVGSGQVRHRVKAPDPFADFDVGVDHVDFWLEDGRIRGEVRAGGKVALGFGFRADVGFSAVPAISGGTLQLDDFKIDEPDVSIDLPWAFELGVGAAAVYALAQVIATPLVGVTVPFLLAAIVSAIVEAVAAEKLSELEAGAEEEDITDLPPGVHMTAMEVTAKALTMRGYWAVTIEDPRPFVEWVRLEIAVERNQVGPTTSGEASLVCRPVLGLVAASEAPDARRFEYEHRWFSSKVTVTRTAENVPLPLTYRPWTLWVRYASPAAYQPAPKTQPAPLPLKAGALSVLTSVWRPEPPFVGKIEEHTFTIDVSGGDDRYELEVPSDAANVTLTFSTSVVDASGREHVLLGSVDVHNETVSFGDDFTTFKEGCDDTRRELRVGAEPSLIDPIWNPPELALARLHHAIRTGEPAIGAQLARVVEAGGAQALEALLAPAKALRR